MAMCFSSTLGVLPSRKGVPFAFAPEFRPLPSSRSPLRSLARSTGPSFDVARRSVAGVAGVNSRNAGALGGPSACSPALSLPGVTPRNPLGSVGDRERSASGGFSPSRGEAKMRPFSTFSLKNLLPNRLKAAPTRPYTGPTQKVVVLGTGWASVNFFRHLDPNIYDVTVISPRNYFTFTPLLPSVCAGTLSPLSCIEPVRSLTYRKGRKVADFYEAHCTDVDFKNRIVACDSRQGGHFKLKYDYLVIAVGSETNTFGIKDVAANAFFLKEVEHAMAIRKKVMNNFELAALPQTPEKERDRLLHFVIVGGGPTGVESAAEFADFIKEDMSKYFPQLIPHVSISLIEGGSRLLGTYPPDISAFAEKTLRDELHVKLLLRSTVVGVDANSVRYVSTEAGASKEPKEMLHGFLLWASGVGEVPLVKKIVAQNYPQTDGKSRLRGLPVDPQFRLLNQPNVYALGDCAAIAPPRLADAAQELFSKAGAGEPTPQWLRHQIPVLSQQFPQLSPLKFNFDKLESNERLPADRFKSFLAEIDAAYRPPAPTAQNARQEGIYLAQVFNQFPHPEEKANAPAFQETWSGSLAYVGSGQAVAHLPYFTIKGGSLSLPFWKAVYTQMQITWRSRTICLFDWLKTFFAGRDVGRDHEYYNH
ncbi:nadh dehydrogenase, related [Neospora caninum Liverpool]|uniref:NADH:ubiquinone reductase (non-electrogenic) n=1 Tax=Neospora caninum (strain Liverpool) TaxID=572307 RepID=F0VBR5_NEOCL|nr:nadh dehydrogenase, related [Neospora caninum Liverpool]CBZ51049.1 nadh dehydrogenase, related [Neospora caninum Liverpool]CEL68355.1 TPA: NADH dehydrogenase, related [Neospora caninum Liverpool]|eukprot:XP_003881082.1 nadh dehydrogenase, related [Neospora caninum Liverpool]